MPFAFVVVSVAVFFLQQIQVEFPGEEEALEWECLQAVESLQAELAPPLPLGVAEAVNPPQELRAAETLQQQSNGFLTQLQVPSRNTMAEVADKSAAWLPSMSVQVMLPYQNDFDPGTAFSDSLLISKEIL
jgi:hypothetical protein